MVSCKKDLVLFQANLVVEILSCLISTRKLSQVIKHLVRYEVEISILSKLETCISLNNNCALKAVNWVRVFFFSRKKYIDLNCMDTFVKCLEIMSKELI